MTEQAEQFETVIVGGGQAGLSAAYHLKRRGRPCVILDANERIGDSWRKRWSSLRLYSPARYDGLPGMPFPARRHAFPTGNEMADYLESYALRFELPVRAGVAVDGLSKEGERYLVTAGERRFEADHVVVATGVFRSPVIPSFATELDPSVRQLHSNDYRSPAQLQEGPVLVVGAAHSGADIAFEVAGEHRTLLSGTDTGQIPFRVDGRLAPVIWPVMRFVATRVLTVGTPIGRKARAKIRAHGGPLLRIKAADLAAVGVERVVAKTVGVQDGMPMFDDGQVAEVANVIWCTGFRNDFSWIQLPVVGEDGYPEQDRGVVAASPGLYFLGLLFLHSFSSMLILGAGRDAERVAKHISSRSNGRPAAQELHSTRTLKGEVHRT
ncbi:MAG: NAD(P)/FAD-dependent oxidoreductase [Gaiellaceae bacterium MAG52_C11]|nr:NAD(P)/FAD-dependent oxidoreductase [Candidatus Gaiellasilicea maunaloa]